MGKVCILTSTIMSQIISGATVDQLSSFSELQFLHL